MPTHMLDTKVVQVLAAENKDLLLGTDGWSANHFMELQPQRCP